MRTNSDFYRSITSHDKTLFCSNLLLALSVVVLVAIPQKHVSLCTRKCLHCTGETTWSKSRRTIILAGESYYFSLKCIDTQDQRISQDTDRLASALSELYCGSIVLPGVVIYYTVCWYICSIGLSLLLASSSFLLVPFLTICV